MQGGATLNKDLESICQSEQSKSERLANEYHCSEKILRVTLYLTPQNKQRLARLRRGEKTKKLNEALNLAFEQEEQHKYFEKFMKKIGSLKPVKPSLSGTDTIRMLREGRDHDLANLI